MEIGQSVTWIAIKANFVYLYTGTVAEFSGENVRVENVQMGTKDNTNSSFSSTEKVEDKIVRKDYLELSLKEQVDKISRELAKLLCNKF